MSIVNEAEQYFFTHLPKNRVRATYIGHVLRVRDYAVLLAEEYGADKEVVEVAAYLHDVGADAGEKHTTQSAEIADVFLSEQGVDEDFKQKVLYCIQSHSDSTADTPEAEIVQEADSLSYFELITYSFYNSHNHSIELLQKKSRKMMGKIKTEKGKQIASELISVITTALEAAKQ